MLAYLFWHRPRHADAADEYEQAEISFHRSLAHRPPVGLIGSAVFRLDELPWAQAPADGAAASQPGPAYEDWYLVEDFAALGVLNEAAVGRGHRTSHDLLARRLGAGAGGLYALLEGEGERVARGSAREPESSLAIWVQRPAGSPSRPLGDLLADGMEPGDSSLWRRQLVLGPAAEYCLLAREAPAGASPTRLPEGWSARALQRRTLWTG